MRTSATNTTCRETLAMALTALLAATAMAGCGSQDDGRQHVSGQITFDGNLVPEGVIYFDPDLQKGNDGRQGVAKIVDGRFDTRNAGKGVTLGPYIARIHGFGPAPEGHWAKSVPLFKEYQVAIDIPDTSLTHDFEVPRSAADGLAPLPAKPN